ncbi:RyR domain-containing protein [uncultured Methanoregula sp.]|uniref:RyR domain-containing protein n=1 Tax=uncultured Methanoregula sp. TaxID=1005933 RepID=UPI002AAB6821|nr:RyR domain-containing protein [uncultured Methanoregula sp.]
MVRLSGQNDTINSFRRTVRSFNRRFDLRNYESMIIIALWAFAFILGYVGYWFAYNSPVVTMSWPDTLYKTLQLFTNNYQLQVPPPNLSLQLARFLAPVLMYSTILFLVATHVYENYQRFLLRITHNHIVICGLGLLGPVLVEQFSREGCAVVVIEKDPTPDEIEQCKLSGAFILTGDASNRNVLAAAGVGRAECLISVTGEDEINAEIAGCAATIPRSKPHHPLTCYLHIVDLNLYSLLKETEFQKANASLFRLDLFNIYQTAGKSALDHPEPFPGNGTDPAKVRLLVIGIGRMGESLIVQAARSWRARFGDTGMKLPITIIDRHADEKKEMLQVRYPAIKKFCEFETITTDIDSPDFNRGTFLKAESGRCPFSRIFICVGDPSLGLAAGLKIHSRLQEKDIRQEGRQVPVIIRTNHETGLSRYLETLKKQSSAFADLHAFPLIDQNCKVDVILNTTHETIARASHEDYVQKEQKKGLTSETNPSMKPWEELPEELKASNRFQADHIIEKLRAISCGVTQLVDWDEPLFDIEPWVEQLARMEHDRWMQEKTAAGYKYGEVRDDRWWHRRHKSMVPYDDLPETEKEKDRDPVRSIPALLKSVDLKIKRL